MCSDCLFLPDSVLEVCKFLEICPFLVGCQICWCITVHCILLFFKKFSLFFLAASSLSCGMQDLHWGMWGLSLWCAASSLWHAGFSLVAVHGLFSSCGVRGFSLSGCGAQAPEHVGSVVCGTWPLSLRHASSVVAAHGLSCRMACGILVPRPRIEPASPALEGGFFTTGLPGKSLLLRFFVSLWYWLLFLILITLSFPVLLIWSLSLFLMRLAKGLSILFIFSKNQFLISLIFSIFSFFGFGLYFIYFFSDLYCFLPSADFGLCLFFF